MMIKNGIQKTIVMKAIQGGCKERHYNDDKEREYKDNGQKKGNRPITAMRKGLQRRSDIGSTIKVIRKGIQRRL